MKTPNRIAVIFRKEFREIFRERRTLMAVIVGPLLLTPGLFALMGTLIGGQAEKAKTQTYSIGVIGDAAAIPALQTAPRIKLVPVTRADAEARIKKRALSAAVIVPNDTAAKLTQGESAAIEILEDAGDSTSQAAASRLGAILETAGKSVVAQRLATRGLPAQFASPYTIVETPIKSGGSIAMLALSQLLPYMLIIAAFSGTIYAAFDQVAGEKERGTLETLLVSPASRRDIVLGKFAATVAVCLVSSLLSIAGLALAFGSGLKAFDWLARGGVPLSPTAIGVIGLALLPLSVLFAGLLLTVSTFARNQKEAQTYLGPLFSVVLIPAAMSMVLNLDVAKAVALVPILNASLIIKSALAGTFDPVFIALAFGSSIVYAALALIFVTRLFQRESVLVKV